MNSLLALAMNPNMSQKDFLRLAEQRLQNQAILLEIAAAVALKLSPEHRLQYAIQVLPLVVMP